ncbi:MAG TPA: amino acid adenylation domain-containing protein [Thermoanaerobaculia bacterium]
MKPLIRRARTQDAAVLAELILIAGESPSGGSYDILFGGDRSSQREQLARLVLSGTLTDFHYSHFFVAELEGEVAAGASGFDPSTSGKRNVVPALQENGWSQAEIADAMERMSPVLRCAADEPKGIWVLEHIATLPRFRRLGLAKRVVSAAIEEGFRAGFDRVQLSLLLGNEVARKLYISLGFREGGPPRKDPRFEAVMGTPGAETLVLVRRDWLGREGGAASLVGTASEESLAFWKRKLAGATPFVALSTDRTLSSRRSFRAAEVSRAGEATVASDLEQLCHREQASFFAVLFAAFNLLLSRLSGQEDLVVSSRGPDPLKPAKQPGDLYSAELALRTDLSGNPAFLDLVKRVQGAAREASEHSGFKFEELFTGLPHDPAALPPVFHISLHVLDGGDGRTEPPGFAAKSLEIPENASPRDLTVYATKRSDGVHLTATYNSDLFDEPRMRILLEQYEGLLRQIARSPCDRIDSYSLTTESARRTLSDASVALVEPRVGLAVEEFLSWVSRTPSAEAVVHGERVLSYLELEKRSRAIAERLIDRGLIRGEVVAVTGPRSAGRVAAMMAVLRSGGVLLTLDPALPLARRQLMVSEARARHLLLVDKPSDFPAAGLEVIEVRSDGSLAESRASRAVLPTLLADDPAYLFFTSGTSGVPKGVLGSQKGLAHFLRWQRDEFAIRPEDRCAHLTGLSFDVVLRDVFLPLTSGASLHVPGFDDDAAARKTLLWLDRARITALHTVPSIAQVWLASASSEVELAGLRWAFFAGEPLTDALVQKWIEAFPKAGDIVNLYGPTETTLAKCFYVVPVDPLSGVQPVGRPLPDTQAFVWRDGERPCGFGEVGEIVLRTPFRTLGYVNASDDQRSRFVPNPFRQDPKDLLYRTGDRGRYRPDGSLEILGRLDDQVKIHGVRVEPEEVAAVVSSQPAVQHCAVVARRRQDGEVELVGYVVPRRDMSCTVEELRQSLSRQLPAVMVPAAFVFLESLPLTPNGKLDRSALPAPAPMAKPRARRISPPGTPVEEVVAGIWESVLGLEGIGREDNFFDLGGHSLKATQVLSRIGQAFGIELSLRALFEAPTLTELASRIEASLVEEVSQERSANPPGKGCGRPSPLDPEIPHE